MPQGASKGERRGGRAKGTPNKATVERALIAARVTAEAEMRGQRLGKEILAKYAAIFDEMADARLLEGNVVEFEKYARLACSIARDLAPYQSPTFRAVDVAPGEKPPLLAPVIYLTGYPADFEPASLPTPPTNGHANGSDRSEIRALPKVEPASKEDD
jgi:hypothetical protein